MVDHRNESDFEHEMIHDIPKGSKDSPFKERHGDSFATRYDVRKLLNGLKRHIILLIICALLGAMAGYYLYKGYTRTIKGEAVVLYQEPALQRPGEDITPSFSLSTALDMIRLPANMQAVKSILGLDLSPKDIEAMIEVPTPRSNSNLIRIVAKGENPNLVVDIANTLAQVAIKSSREFNQRILQLSLDNYKNQLEIVRVRLSNQMSEIEKFKNEHQYLEMTAENSILINQLTEARKKLQDARVRYNSQVAEYEKLKKDVGNLPEKIEITPVAQDSQGQVTTPFSLRTAALESAILEARTKFSKVNPKLLQLETELSELKKQSEQYTKEHPDKELKTVFEANVTKEQLQVELIRMESKVFSAKRTYDEMLSVNQMFEKEIEKLPSEQVAFAKLLQAKELTESQLKYLNNMVDQTQLRINVPKGSLELYYLADKAKPYKDSWWIPLLPFALGFFGFLIGLTFALFIEMEDSHLWTSKQVNMAYTIPCLLTIPELSFLNAKNAEHKMLFFIRSLAERISKIAHEKSLLSQSKKCLSVAFLSSLDKEGKSCIAANLAKYYAKIGKKIILVELDPRKNIFIPKNDTGPSLEAYLSGSLPYHDAIIKNFPDTIRIQTHDPNMKEMLKSQKMNELWDALKNEYEIIIVDTPGIIHEDYAVNVAERVDLNIMVVGGKHTRKGKVDNCLSELNIYGIHPVGIILNRILPVYIDDERIKHLTKQNSFSLSKILFFWRNR